MLVLKQTEELQVCDGLFRIRLVVVAWVSWIGARHRIGDEKRECPPFGLL